MPALQGAPSVKSALGKHSDGGRWEAADINPPTPQDSKIRLKHVTESVPYNTAHAVDHLEEIVNQLGKLTAIDKAKAKELAKGVCKRLDKIHKEIDKYTEGEHDGGK